MTKPSMTVQRFRPLGLGDIFDEAFDLYKRNLAFLLLVTALAIVPLDIVVGIARRPLMREVFALFSMVFGSSSDGFSTWLAGTLVDLMFWAPLYVLAISPLILASSARFLDEPLTLWGAFRLPLRQLPLLFLTVVLVGLSLDIGLLFCGLGYFCAVPLVLFTLHAYVLEGKRLGAALKRSSQLLSGYGGRVFGSLILLWGLAYLMRLGIQLPLGFAFDFLWNVAPGADHLFSGGGATTALNAREEAIAQISGGLAHLLTLPFLACVVTVLYFDLRIRKEAFDVDLLARGLGYPPLTPQMNFLPPVSAAPYVRPQTPTVPPGGARR